MADFDVLLPIKNGIAYLAEAIDSVVNQSHRDWRLLVLDHGSQDGSLELAHRYADHDSRIVVCSFPDAIGLSELLNLGLDRCDCNYVLRQDADDVSLPHRMSAMLEVFRADPDLTLVGSKGHVINKVGKIIGEIDVPLEPSDVTAMALFKTPVAHPTVGMRFSAIKKLGASYGNDFIRSVSQSQQITVPGLAEDYFLFGQLALLAKCINLDKHLIKYRWHDTNVSVTHQTAQLQLAGRISHYLAKSLSLRHGVEHFDPTPLCNHADRLLEMNGRLDFSTEYVLAERLISKIIPITSSRNREMEFRRAISIRSITTMVPRSILFAKRYGIRKSEFKTVKSWLLRRRNKNIATTPLS